MSNKDYRKRIDTLVDMINDDTDFTALTTKGKDIMSISIYTTPYQPDSNWQSEYDNFISLLYDSEHTINKEIHILETYYKRGAKESRVVV